MSKPLIIIGAGGHGKVVLDAALKAGFAVEGFLDDNPAAADILCYKILGSVSDIKKHNESCVFFCAIGSNAARAGFDKKYDAEWTTIIHPSACIGLDVEIGAGTVLLAGCVVNASARVGRHCIINTNSTVEHDCAVYDYVHISPGAVLCGNVSIGALSWVGAGAVIKNGVAVCSGAVIGAGAVVIKDITEAGVYAGVPARRIGMN